MTAACAWHGPTGKDALVDRAIAHVGLVHEIAYHTVADALIEYKHGRADHSTRAPCHQQPLCWRQVCILHTVTSISLAFLNNTHSKLQHPLADRAALPAHGYLDRDTLRALRGWTAIGPGGSCSRRRWSPPTLKRCGCARSATTRAARSSTHRISKMGPLRLTSKNSD